MTVGPVTGALKRVPAVPLTEYAWKFRYPGVPEEPTREEAEEALSIARRVCQAVLDSLPAEVRP